MTANINCLVHVGAVELRNAISQQYSLDLPATLLFDYPTLSSVANYLSKHMARVEETETFVTMDAPLAPLAEAISTSTEVLALSSRHPGPSLGTQGFTHSIAVSADLQSPVPPCRWDIDATYSPNMTASRLTVTTRFGAFCNGVELFDSSCFLLSNAEATAMDPQTR